jgi:hypothetical protein
MVPAGFQPSWNAKQWNVGFCFEWIELYGKFLERGTLTVKPGQTLPDAWKKQFNEKMSAECEIFFVEERV